MEPKLLLSNFVLMLAVAIEKKIFKKIGSSFAIAKGITPDIVFLFKKQHAWPVASN